MVQRFKQTQVVTGVGFGGGEVASAAARAFETFGGIVEPIAAQAAATRGREAGQEAVLAGDTALKSAYTHYGKEYNAIVTEGSAALAKNDIDNNIKRIYDETMATAEPDQKGYYKRVKEYKGTFVSGLPNYLRAGMSVHADNLIKNYGTTVDSAYRKFTVDQAQKAKGVAYADQRTLALSVARQGEAEQVLAARETYINQLQIDNSIGAGDKVVLLDRFDKDMELAYTRGQFDSLLKEGDVMGALDMIDKVQSGKHKGVFKELQPDELSKALEGDLTAYKKRLDNEDAFEDEVADAGYEVNYDALVPKILSPNSLVTELDIDSALMQDEITKEQATMAKTFIKQRSTVDDQNAINIFMITKSGMTITEQINWIGDNGALTGATKEKLYRLTDADRKGVFSTESYNNAEALIKSVLVSSGPMAAILDPQEQEDFALSLIELQTRVSDPENPQDPIEAAKVIINKIKDGYAAVPYNDLQELKEAVQKKEITEARAQEYYPIIVKKDASRSAVEYLLKDRE